MKIKNSRKINSKVFIDTDRDTDHAVCDYKTNDSTIECDEGREEDEEEE